MGGQGDRKAAMDRFKSSPSSTSDSASYYLSSRDVRRELERCGDGFKRFKLNHLRVLPTLHTLNHSVHVNWNYLSC